MTLGNYLIVAGQGPKSLAELIGTSEPTIRRYVSGHRIPRKGLMLQIFVATGGLVTPNDFYGVGAALPAVHMDHANQAATKDTDQ